MAQKIIALLLLLGHSSSLVFSQHNNGVADYSGWSAYGGDAGGCRYSSLNIINEKNVSGLKPAWTFRTGELDVYKGTDAIEKAAFETTPIIDNGTLYFSTPSCRVFAVDAATGKQKWLFDPRVDLKKDFSEITSRGVSLWTKKNAVTSDADRRIFLATIDGRLIALNASSGQVIKEFGSGGTIDLKKNFGNDLSVTSPPAVLGNNIIVGSSLGDNQRIDYPKGTVRAFDAETGKQVWSWDPVPQDSSDKAWASWETAEGRRAGAANAWSIISADSARDIVYIPTSSPATDYYGGQRPGANRYANSIVALKGSTGKMLWSFQVVHHDLWDYDIAAQPVLFDLKKNGRIIPAIAVGTKMGHIFIFDRVTGSPIFGVKEKPVPLSAVPGEKPYPTQPFPVLPAPLGLQSVTAQDAWGPTPELRSEAEKRIRRYVNQGIFTPPSIGGSIITPGNVGGINWSGMCVDPEQQILVTNINWLAALIRLVPREKIKDEEDDEWSLRGETGEQKGTPYVLKRDYLFRLDSSGFMMQTKPPWGTLNAIDLRTGKNKWQVPLGYMLDPQQYPESKKWGSLNFGGAIITKGNLIFVAASRDGYLRAFQSSTGKILWEYPLPAGGQATPMTYSVNGKQFVIIAAGGHGKFLTTQGDYLLAFSLN